MGSEPTSAPAHGSIQTVFRFLLRVALLVVIANLSNQNFGQAFSKLLLLVGVFCAVVAVLKQEPLFGPVLTHWDEAAVFAILGRLALALA
jgi:hypothetical protein